MTQSNLIHKTAPEIPKPDPTTMIKRKIKKKQKKSMDPIIQLSVNLLPQAQNWIRDWLKLQII